MSKKNDDFFTRKSAWAEVKDDLLSYYLAIYLNKIFKTGKPLWYVDCFAGKGVFDDGADGSPVIACKCIDRAIAISKTRVPAVHALFVEKKHAEELGRNLASYPYANAVKGTYEAISKELQKVKTEDNLFLYVDPYGVKSLDFNFFARIRSSFSSVELLVNFNSFGFFRAACRAYGVEYHEPDDFGGMVERDPDDGDTQEECSAKLMKAAGGWYWLPIVEEYKTGVIDGYEAEVKLSNGFSSELRKCYRYVLNIPIRIKEGNRPKYRMVFASNHESGCLHMYDNMQKRLEELHLIQTGGQWTLFSQDTENEIIDEFMVYDKLRDHATQQNEEIPVEIFLARFVSEMGITLSLSNLYKQLKVLEDKEIIRVRRVPEYTASGKKKSSFMQPSKGKQVFIRSRNNASL